MAAILSWGDELRVCLSISHNAAYIIWLSEPRDDISGSALGLRELFRPYIDCQSSEMLSSTKAFPR